MIIVLMGKSGAGTTSIKNCLLEKGFESVPSFTSRAMRDGEVDGKDYFFISEEEFDSKVESGDIFEHRVLKTMVDGKKVTQKYGTSKDVIDNLDKEKNYVFVKDPEGAYKFRELFGATLIYVAASEECRKERVKQRGDFSEDGWQKRSQADAIDFIDVTIRANYMVASQNTTPEENAERILDMVDM